VVPIAVSSTLPDVTSISILVADNPFVLAASYKLEAGTAVAVANGTADVAFGYSPPPILEGAVLAPN